MADGMSKKLRKPYTITKTRDRWAEEEHDRFLDALLLYGRDWKKVEDFVGTKSVIQIRSHAQKYFLKVQKNGIMAHVPPPRLKSKAAYPYTKKAPDSVPPQVSLEASTSLMPTCTSSGADKIPLLASTVFSAASTYVIPANAMWGESSMAMYPCITEAMPESNYNCDFSGVNLMGDNGMVSNASISWSNNSSKSLPDYGDPYSFCSAIPNMAEVYRFIGSMIDPEIKYPLGIYMQKLKKMDPLSVKTVILMTRNLINSLSSSDFDILMQRLMTYNGGYRNLEFTSGGEDTDTSSRIIDVEGDGKYA